MSDELSQRVRDLEASNKAKDKEIRTLQHIITLEGNLRKEQEKCSALTTETQQQKEKIDKLEKEIQSLREQACKSPTMRSKSCILKHLIRSLPSLKNVGNRFNV